MQFENISIHCPMFSSCHTAVGLKSYGTTGRRDRRRETWRSIRHGPLSGRYRCRMTTAAAVAVATDHRDDNIM